MTAPTTYRELVWLHQNSYGQSIRIRKRILQELVTALCLASPGTNWALPFVLPKIQDVKLRW